MTALSWLSMARNLFSKKLSAPIRLQEQSQGQVSERCAQPRFMDSVEWGGGLYAPHGPKKEEGEKKRLVSAGAHVAQECRIHRVALLPLIILLWTQH